MCAPSPPPAPDYGAAAREQGAANVEAAKASGKINNPTVISPYGTQTVEWGKGGTLDQAAFDRANQAWEAENAAHREQYGINVPESAWHEGYRPPRPEDYGAGDPNQPTITQTLSPAQQAILESGQRAKLGLSQLGEQGAESLKGLVGKQIDFAGVPPQAGQSEDVRKRVLAGMMSRVNEDYTRKKDDLHSNLIAAGLRPGNQAYDDQMALLERTRTDANTQAELGAQSAMASQFGLDTQARKDAIAELLMQRQVPLNEITALLSGSQVSNPFAMPGYAQNANVAAAPVFAGTQAAGDWASDLYNVEAAKAGNLQSGLFSLGSAAIMGGLAGR